MSERVGQKSIDFLIAEIDSALVVADYDDEDYGKLTVNNLCLIRARLARLKDLKDDLQM